MREMKKNSVAPPPIIPPLSGNVFSAIGPIIFIAVLIASIVALENYDTDEADTPKKRKDKKTKTRHVEKKEKRSPVRTKRKKRKAQYYREGDDIPAHLRYEFDRKT